MSFDIDTDNWTHELSGYTDNLHKEILILNISKDDLINENYNCVEEIGRFESGDWDSYASILSEEEAEESKKESEKYRKELEDDDENNEYEYFINTTYLYCENKYVHSVSSYTKEESDKLTDDEALSSHKFSQENLDSLKKDKNTKLEILKDIFTDIDFPDYANEEWYSALAHQKSVAKLEYYWEGILPDYPNVAKTLANNHHINKKLLSDVRNFGKKLEKVEETKNIGYAIEDLVFANPIFIELRFEIFPDGKDFFEEFYEPEKRRNTYFPLFLKNPGLPEDILEILELKYNYESARGHINYSENLIIKTLQNKDLSITDKFSFIYSDKCSEKILDALLTSEKNSNNKSNFFSSGRLRKAIALHEKTSSHTVNNLLKDEISWVRKAAASKSILNKKEIDEILKTANQKFPAKSFKFKIKSSYGYGLVEDVGGEVGIDDVVEAILSGEEWDAFIRDEYYS